MAILERSDIEIIRAVNQHGFLAAAAEQLHVTQSVLNHSSEIKAIGSSLLLAIFFAMPVLAGSAANEVLVRYSIRPRR